MTTIVWFPHGRPNLIRQFLKRLCELRDEGLIDLYSGVDGKACYVFSPKILP